MKQHRPRVSEENYQRVMSYFIGRFDENETFDDALWLLLTENKDLNKDAERDNGVIKLLRKELNNVTDLLIDENKRSNSMQSLAITGYIGAIGLLVYIGFCL